MFRERRSRSWNFVKDVVRRIGVENDDLGTDFFVLGQGRFVDGGGGRPFSVEEIHNLKGVSLADLRLPDVVEQEVVSGGAGSEVLAGPGGAVDGSVGAQVSVEEAAVPSAGPVPVHVRYRFFGVPDPVGSGAAEYDVLVAAVRACGDAELRLLFETTVDFVRGVRDREILARARVSVSKGMRLRDYFVRMVLASEGQSAETVFLKKFLPEFRNRSLSEQIAFSTRDGVIVSVRDEVSDMLDAAARGTRILVEEVERRKRR